MQKGIAEEQIFDLLLSTLSQSVLSFIFTSSNEEGPGAFRRLGRTTFLSNYARQEGAEVNLGDRGIRPESFSVFA
jgi:hypothetical protein